MPLPDWRENLNRCFVAGLRDSDPKWVDVEYESEVCADCGESIEVASTAVEKAVAVMQPFDCLCLSCFEKRLEWILVNAPDVHFAYHPTI